MLPQSFIRQLVDGWNLRPAAELLMRRGDGEADRMIAELDPADGIAGRTHPVESQTYH